MTESRTPDYVILSGGGSIADLSGLDPEIVANADRLIEDFIDGLIEREKEHGEK